MDGWRVEVEPALAAPNEAARQLRLHDPAGTDRAVVVSFEDEGGEVVNDYKAEVKRQLEALKATE
ncbi:MAG TPA: hypothetical protein VN282_10995 [Pyrinomonadaceae bacterium]|nr:hypothetical protein [Pyrinomonadaceae bacterium]